MQYTIIITHADGTQTHASTNATNAKTAHEWAQHLATDGATVRAYPTTQDEHGNINAYAVLRGALQVAKKSAEKAISNGGTDTQYRICNELTGANARAGQNGAEERGTAYILDITARLSADSQAIFSDAYSGILDGINDGADITEQYHNAYLTINASIMAQRSASIYELSTEFIEEQGGALVAINSYIARILNNGERYTPTNNGELDADTIERLGRALSGAAIALTPRQKDIVKYLAGGCSQRYTAKKLNIKNVATINEHLTRIRKIYLEYFTENAPELLYLIDCQAVENAKTDRHANTDERRRANAEKQRRYRERKKAERNA